MADRGKKSDLVRMPDGRLVHHSMVDHPCARPSRYADIGEAKMRQISRIAGIGALAFLGCLTWLWFGFNPLWLPVLYFGSFGWLGGTVATLLTGFALYLLLRVLVVLLGVVAIVVYTFIAVRRA